MTTRKDIDLFPFCNTKRLDIAKPLRVNGRDALATDGAITVVVSDHSKANEFRIAYPNTYSNLLNALKDYKANAPYRSDKPSIRLDAMHIEPPPDCPECGGTCEMKKHGGWCPECYGCGTQYVPVAVGSAHFQLAYLHMMSVHLPHCTLQLPTDDCILKNRMSKPTPFVFEGGYGWMAACIPEKTGVAA